MMKKLSILSVFALALFAVGTLFMSCGSDDDDQEPNTVTNSKGTFKFTSATIMDMGSGMYSISLSAHPGNGVMIGLLKSDICKRVDLSKRGSWRVDSPSTGDVRGERETLQSGSYFYVSSYANGKITLTYHLKKSTGNGDVEEKGNYSGDIRVTSFNNP